MPHLKIAVVSPVFTEEGIANSLLAARRKDEGDLLILLEKE
jgi:hypothetical protein